MKKTGLILGFLFLVLVAGFGQGAGDAEVLFKAGNDKLKANDYYGAVRDFNRALKLRPEYPEALAGRAFARNKLGDSDAALTDADAAVQLAGQNPAIVFNRAEIFFDQKKYREALDDYSETISLQEDYPGAFRGKVLSMYFTGQEKEAMALVESRIKSKPEESLYYYLNGLLLTLKQKYNKALEYFDKALALNPGDIAASCYLNRGIAYLGVEENEHARDDLNEAISLDTTNLVAYLSRGRAYYNLRSYEEAIQDFTRVVTLSPTNDAAFYNLGMAYYRIENKASACQNFHKACSMGNNNACRMIVMECSEVKQ
ncbi:MAG: tetratricopeptide repeat protein [Bacteroidales bacterium]